MRFLLLFIFLSCFQATASGPGPLLPVRRGGLWGYINKEGAMVIQPSFIRADPFAAGATIGRVLLPGNKPAVIDRTGQIRFTTDASNLNILTDSLIAAGQDGAWGLYSITGTELMPRQYERFYRTGDNAFWMARKRDKCALLTRSGNLILPAEYDSLTIADSFINTRNGLLIGRCRINGKRILPCTFDSIRYTPDGYFCLRQGKRGLYDVNGTELLACRYAEIRPVGRAFLKARQTPKSPYRLFVRRTKTLLGDTTWRDFEMLDSMNVIVTGPSGRGVMREDGQLLVPARYTGVSGFSRDVFAVNLKGKFGLVSAGSELLPPQFDVMGTPIDGLALVKTEKLWGAIDTKGKTVIPRKYDNIYIYEDAAKAWCGKSMDLYTFDTQGRIQDMQHYGRVMEIKVRGREKPSRQSTFNMMPVTWNRIASSGSSGASDAPRNSRWFQDYRSMKWGMNDKYGRRKIAPAYDFVSHYPKIGLTLVSINTPSKSITIDQEKYSFKTLYGLVDDSTGKILLAATYLHIDLDDCFTKGTNMIRALHSSGTFTLLRFDGKIVKTGLRYAGRAADGKVRICIGGRFTLKRSRSGDATLGSLREFLKTFDWINGDIAPKAMPELSDPHVRVAVTGGKWGYLTEAGGVLIKEKYEFGYNFDRGQAIVCMGGKWGVITASGDTVLNFRYSRIVPLPGSSGDHYLVSVPNEKQGYVHSSGQVRVEPDYKNAQPYSEGKAWMRQGRQFLAMDSQGHILHRAAYQNARPFGSGLAPVQVRGGWVYVTPEGDTAFGGQRFSRATSFSQGLAAVADKAAKWGYINEDGKWVIPPHYQKAAAFHPNGLAMVWKESHCGLINREGKTIVNCRYNRIGEYSCGRYVAQGDDGWILLDSLGQGRKPPKEATKVNTFREGLAAVLINNKFGFIDTEGKLAIQPTYGTNEGFNCGIAVCGRGAEKTAVDTGGRVILNKVRLTGRFSEGKGIMMLPGDTLCVFVDRAGQILFGRRFQGAFPFENGIARVREKGRWGLIDARGMAVLSPRYDAISPMSENMMSIRLDNWVGAADRSGQFIITPDYDNICTATNGLFRVEHANRMGYLDNKGKWVWPMGE